MSGTLAIEVAGERLLLHAARALSWPARRTLLVADVHFGKAHVLRSAGVGVPRGSTTHDLARLDRLIADHDVARVLVLGDLVHGRSRDDAPWAERVREWRARHAALDVALVRGNHDRHFAGTGLGFRDAGIELRDGPFAFVHHPHAVPGHYAIAGHLHPGVLLAEAHGRPLRLPAFRFARDVGVLPAFGRLTGVMAEPVEPGERVVAVVGEALVALPSRK